MREKTNNTADAAKLSECCSLTEARAIGGGFLLLLLATASIVTFSDPIQEVTGINISGEEAAALVRDLALLALLSAIAWITTRQIRSGFAALEERISQREDNLKAAVTDLSVENSQLARLSTTDCLTGARNRRYFDDALDREWERSVQLGYSLALALVDIDRFKMINDVYGHAQGDECLLQVAGALQSKMKHPGDIVARYGGDEFAVLMPNASEAGIQSVLEDVRGHIERLTAEPAVGLSISAGAVACWPKPGLEPKRLVRLADEQLYAAKRAGRNRVSV
jgi:diguanylate cyclase (GGDEF)-like protein